MGNYNDKAKNKTGYNYKVDGKKVNNNSSYVGAPYNFVPFERKVYQPVKEEQLGVHDVINDELITGEITYDIEAITPLFVNAGKDRGNTFFKNENGNIAIPGSTLRGLIRNNVQILSASDFGDDIDDYKLMYRHVATGKLKKKYGSILGNSSVSYRMGDKTVNVSVLKNVKAGYIKKDGNKMYIYPANHSEDMKEAGMPNYYILNERTIVDNYIKSKKSNKTFSYPLFGDEEKTILQHRINVPFEKRVVEDETLDKYVWSDDCKVIYYKTMIQKDKKVNIISEIEKDGYLSGYSVVKMTDRGTKMTIFDNNKECLTTGDIHYIGEENKEYIPYMLPCSFEVNGKNIIEVKEPNICRYNGWVVSTGKMNEKKSLYIIPGLNDVAEKEQRIELSSNDIKAYKIDYNNKENTLTTQFLKNCSKDEAKKKAYRFYGLPDDGELKPIFYIAEADTNRVYFGFTPHLRLFYKNSVKDGYRRKTEKGYDFTTSIFGVSNNEKSYKSKVSFIDAEIIGDPGKSKTKKVILAGPKPSSYLDYIEQSVSEGKVNTYESADFKLRGVKQYWLHREIEESEIDQNKERIVSIINCLPEKTRFSGVIRFHSLTELEVGLLLWALRLEKNSNMNVGMGKPYGYGRIKVLNIKLKILDNNKAYSLEKLCLDPFTDAEVDSLIDNYKNTEIFGVKVTEMESIKQFFKMKDETLIPESNNIRYMDIGKYQHRVNDNIPLGTIDEVIQGIHPASIKKKKGNFNNTLSGGYNKSRASVGRKDSRYVSVKNESKDDNIKVFVYSKRKNQDRKKYAKMISAKLGTSTQKVDILFREGFDFFDRLEEGIVIYEKDFKLDKTLKNEINRAKKVFMSDGDKLTEN